MFLFRAHSMANGSNKNVDSIRNSHQRNAIELYRHLYLSYYIFSVTHIHTVVNECGGHKERIITQLLFALFVAYKCKWETIAAYVLVRVNVLKNLWNVHNILTNVDFVFFYAHCPCCFSEIRNGRFKIHLQRFHHTLCSTWPTD